MTETQERFLKAVADRVPLDRVAEVYLFPAIRQGGVETGIAVVAAQADATAERAPDAEHPSAADAGGEAVAESAAADVAGGAGFTSGAGRVPTDRVVAGTMGLGAASVGAPADLAIGVISDASEAPDDATVALPAHVAGIGAGEGGEDAPGAPPRQHGTAGVAVEHNPATAVGTIAPHAGADDRPGALGRPGEADRSDVSVEVPVRHTIFSARYRLALKGPDRGKWEVDVVAEADAPLVTVDAIVRGIRKRTGEAADAERVLPDVLRGLAAQPA